ncbi:glycosyltransferase family 2 protein [Paenibacillus sp. UNC499MF]|uniref:glycosyltransferase family 2 protein n=1 Tax=Paenibacillus sp. UNC499MF TaxID=1502751 RepID=UPI0008A03B6F|nr:glycosyltransferase family 2 protein [Paenibacillus sp. UNC499MF]SEF85666.1 dTDP-glucose pyrophosphorylase [Paenibacillus sp. UNC499MF]
MKTVQIVIPMAGRGQRFRSAGISVPKMLIPVAGKPMLQWALESLMPHFPGNKILFVCLEDHLKQGELERVIGSCCENAGILSLPEVTGGQAETVLSAEACLDPELPLLIYNCDTYTESSIGETIRAKGSEADGIISVFASANPAYSYVRTDGSGRVAEVREKRVISNRATTGLYYFRKAGLFLEPAEEAVRLGTEEGEVYVAPLYNRLIGRGLTVVADQADRCFPLGTPDEIAEFTRNYRKRESEGT